MALEDFNPFDLSGSAPAMQPTLASSVPILMDQPADPEVQVASTVDPSYLYAGLIKRGLTPQAAYATLGNWKQESEFNSSALNPGEGAYGLDQWRLDRRDKLDALAKKAGKNPSDPDVQMDHYMSELHSHAGGKAVLGAKDIGEANSALKTFIGYGDDSEKTRLENAYKLAGQKFPTSSGPSGPILADTRHQAPTADEVAATDASQGSTSSADAGAVDPAGRTSLMKMMLAASLANVRLQPVDYDPYKVMPHIQY